MCLSAAFAQSSLERACIEVVKDVPREYAIRVDSQAYKNSVFDKYCQRDGSIRSSSSDVSLDIVVAEIPLGFSSEGTSSEERVSSFCRDYASTYASASDAIDWSEKVVTRAYDSFDQCVALAAQGIQLRHSVEGINSMNFYIAPGFARPVNVKGISSSRDVTCVARRSSDEGTIDLNIASITDDIVLSGDQTLNIACTRERNQSSSGDSVYTESFATVQTNVNPSGNYTAWLPADTLYPENRASVLNKQISTLTESTMEAEAKINELSASLNNANYRLDNHDIKIEKFYTGEYATTFGIPIGVGRHFPCYTPGDYIAQQIGGDGWTLDSIELITDRPGDLCGYAQYVAVYKRFPSAP